MAWYSTGTVAVTLNSPTVTGTGTTFSANVRVGDAFRGPDGRWYEVTNVASSTVISIKPNYQGSTSSGQSYAVAPILGYDKDLSDRFNLIANQWGQPWRGSSPGRFLQMRRQHGGSRPRQCGGTGGTWWFGRAVLARQHSRRSLSGERHTVWCDH